MLISLHKQATTTPKIRAAIQASDGAGLEGGGALRHLRADRLEMAQAGQRSRPQPHRAPAADDADAGAGGGRSLSAQDPVAAARRSARGGARVPEPERVALGA